MLVWSYIEILCDLLWFLFVAFATRLFSVLRFESVIHEFDPYFNYRTTKYLAEQGFYSFHNWFDDRAWYPLGRIIGGKKSNLFATNLIRLELVQKKTLHCKD